VFTDEEHEFTHERSIVVGGVMTAVPSHGESPGCNAAGDVLTQRNAFRFKKQTGMMISRNTLPSNFGRVVDLFLRPLDALRIEDKRALQVATKVQCVK
jgi:hypothetical protein